MTAKLAELEASVIQDVEHLGSVPFSDKSKNQRVSRSIQDKLAQIRALTRDLELLYEEIDSEEEQQQVAVLVSQHKAEYERIQQAYKQAVLQQRLLAVQRAASERKELLADAADPAAKQRLLVEQGQLVSASANATEGLRRTRQVLTEQLDHTSTTLAAMEQSHAQLGKTKEEYHQQAGQLKTSMGLLGTLNWQQTAERLMLWVGLACFMLAVAYIVQKRVGHFLPSALSPTAILSSSWTRLSRLTQGGVAHPSPTKMPQGHLVSDPLPVGHYLGGGPGGRSASGAPPPGPPQRHLGEQGWRQAPPAGHAGHEQPAQQAQQQLGMRPIPHPDAGLGEGWPATPEDQAQHAQQGGELSLGHPAVHAVHAPSGQAGAAAGGVGQQNFEAPQAPPAVHAVPAEAPQVQHGGGLPHQVDVDNTPGGGAGQQWHGQQQQAAVPAEHRAPQHAGSGHAQADTQQWQAQQAPLQDEL